LTGYALAAIQSEVTIKIREVGLTILPSRMAGGTLRATSRRCEALSIRRKNDLNLLRRGIDGAYIVHGDKAGFKGKTMDEGRSSR
jgi:hypothetical protein